MDFDFKLQKSLKSLQATQKTNYREVSKKRKIRERDKKVLVFLLIFIFSTWRVGRDFLNTVFINPEVYVGLFTILEQGSTV